MKVIVGNGEVIVEVEGGGQIVHGLLLMLHLW
jgi:hypothetical protein